MLSILNYVFIIVFYMMGWTKLDHVCICSEKFINQLNLLYICICLFLQQDKGYQTHELGRGPNFFTDQI
jgi:hypothetical protein